MNTAIIIIVALVLIGGIVFFLMQGGGNAPRGQGQVQSRDGVTRIEESSSSLDIEKEMENDLKDDDLVTKYTEGTGEGIAEVEKLLSSDPENVDLLDWLAFMYYSNSQIDKAIETYRKVLKINPNNENQHYYLANAFYKKGMPDEARKEWGEVIRLKPGSKIAKNSQQRIEALSSRS